MRRQLTDEEVEKVDADMKIFVLEKPKFITFFLKLIFKVRDK